MSGPLPGRSSIFNEGGRSGIYAPLNHVRLHAALGYFEPRELHLGNPSHRREVRRQKLDQARCIRRTYNRSLLAA